MDLKIGMRLLIEGSERIITITNVSKENVTVYSENFVGIKELDLSKTYIVNGLLHGNFRIVRDRKNNYW